MHLGPIVQGTYRPRDVMSKGRNFRDFSFGDTLFGDTSSWHSPRVKGKPPWLDEPRGPKGGPPWHHCEPPLCLVDPEVEKNRKEKQLVRFCLFVLKQSNDFIYLNYI